MYEPSDQIKRKICLKQNMLTYEKYELFSCFMKTFTFIKKIRLCIRYVMYTFRQSRVTRS